MGNTFLDENEREKLENIISSMSPEEQMVVAGKIELDILWDVLRARTTVSVNFEKAMRDMCR